MSRTFSQTTFVLVLWHPTHRYVNAFLEIEFFIELHTIKLGQSVVFSGLRL